MRLELEKLIELQKTDTDIRRLEKSVKATEERQRNLELEFDQKAVFIGELLNRRDSLSVALSDLERQIAENCGYLELSESSMKHAPSHKEKKRARGEAEAVQKIISMLRSHVLDKISAIDEVEKELDARADEITNLETDRAMALKALDANLAAEKKELGDKSKKRQACFVALPKRIATVYDRLEQRSRDGIAVTLIVNGTCSACFISLRPQLMLDVKMGKELVACENCSKILYVVSENNQFCA